MCPTPPAPPPQCSLGEADPDDELTTGPPNDARCFLPSPLSRFLSDPDPVEPVAIPARSLADPSEGETRPAKKPPRSTFGLSDGRRNSPNLPFGASTDGTTTIGGVAGGASVG